MAKTKKSSATATVDRRATKERRANDERRTKAKSEAVSDERRAGQRREKVNRRRQIDPTTCERDYTQDEVEFMQALDDYKRKSGRMFPTCSEVLEVIRDLGYVKLQPGQAPVAPTTSAEPQLAEGKENWDEVTLEETFDK